jgi:hypothetical protein
MPNVRYAVLSALIVAALLAPDAGHAYRMRKAHLYSSEASAQKHCPGGEIVWVHQPSWTYYVRGSPEYGISKGGRYACLSEVKLEPRYHPPKNSQ